MCIRDSSYTVRRWRLGEYIRLSKEDLKKGKDDSNSVINQRDLLNDFYQKHIGEFESVSEYVDDGHTGTCLLYTSVWGAPQQAFLRACGQQKFRSVATPELLAI